MIQNVRKPKILLSCNNNRQNYIDAVNMCGGIPVAEYLPDTSTDYDGLILCGGNDINPKLYNEPVNGAVNIDNGRDIAEYKIIEKFLNEKKPILGICRGCQLINVYFGGSLIQDLPNGETHKSEGDAIHETVFEQNCFLSKIYGENITVNSMHHQAICTPGDGFVPVQYCKTDRVIEAIEHKNLPIIAVQWHPERMIDGNNTDIADGKKIFKLFMEMCSKNSTDIYKFSNANV